MPLRKRGKGVSNTGGGLKRTGGRRRRRRRGGSERHNPYLNGEHIKHISKLPEVVKSINKNPSRAGSTIKKWIDKGKSFGPSFLNTIKNIGKSSTFQNMISYSYDKGKKYLLNNASNFGNNLLKGPAGVMNTITHKPLLIK